MADSCTLVWHKVSLSLPSETKTPNAMIGNLITMALAALAIWLLVDSAVEFIDGQDDSLATEP